MTNPFDYLNAINTTKENLIVDSQSEKDYVPYLINRGLSMFSDTVLYANEMNMYHEIPKKNQFEFYINSISKRKRFSKWHKRDAESEDLKLIAKYFCCSYDKAKTTLSLLTAQQIDDIRIITSVGGLTKQ